MCPYESFYSVRRWNVDILTSKQLSQICQVSDFRIKIWLSKITNNILKAHCQCTKLKENLCPLWWWYFMYQRHSLITTSTLFHYGVEAKSVFALLEQTRGNKIQYYNADAHCSIVNSLILFSSSAHHATTKRMTTYIFEQYSLLLYYLSSSSSSRYSTNITYDGYSGGACKQ